MMIRGCGGMKPLREYLEDMMLGEMRRYERDRLCVATMSEVMERLLIEEGLRRGLRQEREKDNRRSTYSNKKGEGVHEQNENG
jgi:hypothetical protein